MSTAASAGTVVLSASNYSVAQNAGSVAVTVNRVGGTNGAVTVRYSTTNNTAISGTDYVSVNGTLSWTDGDAAAKTVSISIVNAPAFSGSKNFNLNLSAPTGGVALGSTVAATVTINGSGATSTADVLSVRVQGNHLIDSQGNVLQLRGVNVSGLEFTAIQGWSPGDPWGGQAPNWTAIKAWKANAVRLPLNQASWLGQTCKDPATGVTRSADPGSNYVATVTKAVSDASAAGLYVILDLHMSAPGSYCPMIQNSMADATNSIAFWTSLAQAFKSQPNVIFELFNEPFVTQTTHFSGDGWQYLMKGTGGPFTGFIAANLAGGSTDLTFSWNIASMQTLLNAVRATGASNVVLVSGLNYAQAFDGWLTNRPTDSLNQLGAVWHSYPAYGTSFGTAAGAQPYNAPAIFTQAQAILDAGVPIVMTEMGDQCSDGTPNSPEVTNMLTWADARNVSALGWTWNAWGHGAGCEDILIKDASGTPTDGYGQVFHTWLVNHP